MPLFIQKDKLQNEILDLMDADMIKDYERKLKQEQEVQVSPPLNLNVFYSKKRNRR